MRTNYRTLLYSTAFCLIAGFSSCSDETDLGGSLQEIQTIGEFYQFNLSSCIRQQNSLTAQFVSFSLANLANIFYPPRFLQ